jgi:hypothetical protein
MPGRISFLMLFGCLMTFVCASLLQPKSAHSQLFGGGGSATGPEFLIERSKSGKSLYAYSASHGVWEKLSAQPNPREGPSQSNSVAAIRSKDAVHGFSSTTGKWDSVKTDGNPSQIHLYGEIAGCVSGTKVYGFSSTTGKWSNTDVGVPTDLKQMLVDANLIQYRNGSKIHVFSSATGKWAGVDLADD